MRLFVAIQLPEAWRQAVEATASALRRRLGDEPGLRFTSTDRLHLTLRFLGEVDDALEPELRAALEREVTAVEVPLELAAAGAFGSRSRPTVLWLGVAGDLDGLAALRAAIDRAAVAAGLQVDDRPLRAHVTLARVERRATPEQRRAISDAVRALDPPPPSSFVASEVALVRSYLGRGARYELLARVPPGRWHAKS
jgi:2'-5' RNA ligase